MRSRLLTLSLKWRLPKVICFFSKSSPNTPQSANSQLKLLLSSLNSTVNRQLSTANYLVRWREAFSDMNWEYIFSGIGDRGSGIRGLCDETLNRARVGRSAWLGPDRRASPARIDTRRLASGG